MWTKMKIFSNLNESMWEDLWQKNEQRMKELNVRATMSKRLDNVRLDTNQLYHSLINATHVTANCLAECKDNGIDSIANRKANWSEGSLGFKRTSGLSLLSLPVQHAS